MQGFIFKMKTEEKLKPEEKIAKALVEYYNKGRLSAFKDMIKILKQEKDKE